MCAFIVCSLNVPIFAEDKLFGLVYLAILFYLTIPKRIIRIGKQEETITNRRF